MTRANDAAEFIAKAGWSDAVVAPLAGDASNRRYDRLTRADGMTAVLMDAPPGSGEDVRPFVRIARHLESLGLSAPQIMAEDNARGFLLIEDLGDRLFAREIARDPSLETPLYRAAVDVLRVIQTASCPELEPYDSNMTVPLAALAYDWYQFGATGAVDDTAREHFMESFRGIIAPYDSALTVLIQRDYHAENLLWLPERVGHTRVGLLDFQSAMRGHCAYDLVSVLQDARRDVSDATQAGMMTYFISLTGQDRDGFEAAYAVFGAQRCLRILGVFARLCMKTGKAHYIDLIPRVWGHLLTNLHHPALFAVADRVLTDLPPPSAEVLATLKGKSGICAGQS